MGVRVPEVSPWALWRSPESLYNDPCLMHTPGMGGSPLTMVTQLALVPHESQPCAPEASVHLVSESLSSSVPHLPHL